MSKQSTPREIAAKTSPILSVLSGIGTFVLLQALDAIHLWALALLVALLTETATFVIIKWSAETFISSKVKGVSDGHFLGRRLGHTQSRTREPR